MEVTQFLLDGGGDQEENRPADEEPEHDGDKVAEDRPPQAAAQLLDMVAQRHAGISEEIGLVGHWGSSLHGHAKVPGNKGFRATDIGVGEAGVVGMTGGEKPPPGRITGRGHSLQGVEGWGIKKNPPVATGGLV